MTEPCDLSAVAARALIGAKKLSARELLDSCIRRMDAIDPAVNAMVARDDDKARKDAGAADEATARGDALGPLHGLPVGIKDLENTAGLRTTYGSALYRDFVPTEDQLIVASVRKAGAIIAGKTNTPEW
ncbi:amidase family protein, partial [Bosea sp. ASV33]|uniref:amidase family protein n=1 Tax=Bosea sp. ASV33 TaxID=2795106 RepID=UPI0020C14BDF